jgi:RNA polymerase sigma-70 factor (ECF subfamily)
MPAAANEFMEWYSPLHDRFARYCASQSLGLASGKDIMQDAILSALERWDEIEDKERLLAYMIGIVNNRMRNYLRSARVHRQFVAARKEVLTDRLPARPEVALDLHYLLKAIDTLAPASREALLLAAVSGFSIREIAAIQRSSEGAVKTRISRARHRLRDVFAEEGRPLSLSERLRIYSAILL